jgi:hypothetical protein
MPVILTAVANPAKYFNGIATNNSNRKEIPSIKPIALNRPIGVDNIK